MHSPLDGPGGAGKVPAMQRAPLLRLAAAALFASACGKTAADGPRTCAAVATAAASARPGSSGGTTLLPNGRGLAPAGELLRLGDPALHEGGQSPQRVLLSPDGTRAVTADFGVDYRSVTVAAVAAGQPMQVLQHLAAPDAQGNVAYLGGLAFSSDGATLYAANTGADRIDVFTLSGTGFTLARSLPVQGGAHWPADLALSPDGATLYVTLALSGVVHAYATDTFALLAQQGSGDFPHALLLASDTLYVANEGSQPGAVNHVVAFAAATLAQTARWEVGKNPAALALSRDGRTLFVAAADADEIDRIDLPSGTALPPFILAPPGDPPAPALARTALSVSPNALALSPDGATLYVSAALLNAVAVLDAASGAVRGFVPTGFRPSSVAVSADGATLFVASARGRGTTPDTPQDGASDLPRGGLQRIALGALDLAAATESVATLAGLPAHTFAAPDPDCARIGPLPARRGGDPSLSQIKHVIYVLKENKTFDSVFGDFPGAEASADLLEFGARITPNQHALAQQFCLLDNFYAESEQSVEGHFWVTANVTNDYFERVWAGPWGGRVAASPPPPGGLARTDSPAAGFVWDALARARIGYRSYGEFAGIGGDLNANIDYAWVLAPAQFLARPDTEKLPLFLAALRAGKLDPFTFVALQWDHTWGSAAGKPAPDYMVADNDAATGQLVEAVSRSPYWSDTLILITEDDPSGAADHVDAHRSFALVVSPWAVRGKVSHVRASFPSLAATYERALGLPPLSAYDAAAAPLWDCLAAAPDATPFTALPSNIAPHMNRRGDPGEPESRALDFSAPDRARGLSVVLWKAMRPGEPVPARVRDARDDDDHDDAQEKGAPDGDDDRAR